VSAVFEPGAIVWSDLSPTLASEQTSRRPVLVISEVAYNAISSRVLVCPISRRQRDWPFDVALPDGLSTRGDILVDQVRALDQKSRLFRFIEKVPPETLVEVRALLSQLIGLQPPTMQEDAAPL
jgi:mRNA interferase MazF